MKQKLLLTILLITSISWGNPSTTNPLIGITVAGFTGGGGQFFYSINIKNTGEETLTNIFVTDFIGGGTFYSFGTIPTLAPGEEVLNLQAFRISPDECFDQCQLKVHATTIADTEITDLSSDPNYYDINNLPGNYYNDYLTYTQYFNFIIGSQDGIYNDLNNNSIVDVGDAVNYTYFINNPPQTGEIVDNNAIVTNPTIINNGVPYVSGGIHYLTQADVDLGYVYNSSSILTFEPCSIGGPFQDVSFCACPNPTNANIVTQLTSLLPNQISGSVKFNTNNDNCATGSAFTDKRVTTTDGTYTYATYTNANGNYHILIPNTGSYTTNATTSLSNNFSSNPATVVTASSGSGVDYNNTNFCVGSATNYTDLNVNMFNVNQAIPGNIATYIITYRNNGSTALSGSIQLTYDNGKLSLANASPIQNSSTANTLTWNYTNLLPFETRYINLYMNVGIPPTVTTSDLLAFTVNATPIAGDNVPANNTMTWNQPVRSSFDPNDKTVIEGSSISIAQATNYLTYVTRFQNTGNANATTVVIKETLDSKLDWDTFEPIASSHVSNIQIKNGNELTYTFSNIDLAYESANEPASHGWMAYRIKPKNNVVVGDIMASNSNIYFDYNLPILTNTVSTTVSGLSTNDFVRSKFTVYPNPASNYLIIKTELNTEAQYEIIDINGKLLLNNTIESMNPISINMLQSGFYFLNIKTDQGKATYKFIKN